MKMQMLTSTASWGFKLAKSTVINSWKASVATFGLPATIGITAAAAVPVVLVAQQATLVIYGALAIGVPSTIPSVNYRVTEYSLDKGYTGLADFCLSLKQACSRIPLLRNFFLDRDYTRLLNDGMLHRAIETGNFTMAKLLVRNGTDINIQTGNYAAPLALVLDSGKPGSDELALLMIRSGANLAMLSKLPAVVVASLSSSPAAAIIPSNNIFHQIIKSGKIELIRAALAILNPVLPAHLAILNSVDAHNNSIEHIAAANSAIKTELGALKRQHPGCTNASLNTTNSDNNTVLDIAIQSHKAAALSAGEVDAYVSEGTITCERNKIRYLIENDELRALGTARRLIESKPDYLVGVDAFGKHVLHHAIMVGDDALASAIALATPDAIADSKLLGLSYRNQLPRTCDILLKKSIGNEADLINFLHNPEDDGVSALHKFSSGEWAFNADHFMMCYQAERKFAKDTLEDNPLTKTDKMGLNAFYHSLLSGATRGDLRAPRAILHIMANEDKPFMLKLIGPLDNEKVELLAPLAKDIRSFPALMDRIATQINRGIEDDNINTEKLGAQLKLLQVPDADRQLSLQ